MYSCTWVRMLCMKISIKYPTLVFGLLNGRLATKIHLKTGGTRPELTPTPPPPSLLKPHICVMWWLVACSAPSSYLNQCWFMINCTLWNQLQLNLNRNSENFFKNAFENVVCEMAAILSRGRWVKNDHCRAITWCDEQSGGLRLP